MNINVKEGTIGPAHDPYGTTTVIVTLDDRTVTHYSDGLGSVSVSVDKVEVFSSRRGDEKAVSDAGKMIFEKHAGISLSDARHEYDILETGYEWNERIYM